MSGNFDGLQRQNSRDRFLGDANDFLRNAPNSFRGKGSISASPNSLANTADQVSEYFERIAIAGERVILDGTGIHILADGSNFIIFNEQDDEEDVGYLTGLQTLGYHRMDLFALAPVGSTEEAHVRFVAANFASGLEATFNLYTDEPATVDLRGLAAADQKLILYGGLQIDDDYDINLGTSGGTKIGTATTQKLAFWGEPPITQPAALTAALTQITHTEPSTPDYAIQTATAGGLWGFVTNDEMRTVLKVIKNLQVRVDEWETAAVSEGLIDASGGGGGGAGGTPGNTGVKVATAVETASPTWTGWTAANLNTVDNAFASYGPTETASGFQTVKTFAFGVPGSATIIGIKARVYATSTRKYTSHEVKLSPDGGSSYTAVKTFTPTGNPQWFTLGGSTDLWGRVWADTEFSDANFRLALRKTLTTFGVGELNEFPTVYIDRIEVTVYYET